ncbi:transporter substrate-binding domain-containing protein [Caproiciproducens sp. NJN-50]|uniref:ABC transporter substrate-binding protein n=1 Tax=Acutalibacteraceae TaxID=3082771 RepID=UPI000FFE326B|nr:MULTISPECIES: ABC transporter substrate-binding protein [Acutalibacteraceae]QAT50965.1 transporter substrate-binding domain-containing protein [Caproiciproducens sp. NJN-50]
MKRLLSAMVSVLMIAAAFTGCGGNGSSQTSQSSSAAASSSASSALPTIKMRVAYMPNMSSASAVVAGIQMGYFKEQGIDIETVKFSKGPDEIAAMGSGNIDVAQIGTGAHVLCAKGQAKIFAYDDSSINDEVMVNKEKGITKAADLKGKTVAATLGTSSEQILKLVLESAGMTEKDVNVVQMDASAAATAMISGKVDACATWSPSTITIQEKMGDKVMVLANNKTFADKTTSPSSFICTNDYYTSHQENLVRFTSALLKAQDYRESHLNQVADWVAELIQQDKTTIEKTTGDSEWPKAEQVYNQAKDGSLKKMYEVQQKNFVSSGSLAAAVDVSNYFSPDIMIEAYEANQK